MRHHLAKLAPAFLVGGCSLIYNPSNIGQPPADATDAPMIDVAETMIDAAIDAPPLADADFSMLMLEKVAPVTLLEGQGVDGSRQAIVVVRGMHIHPDATIAITPVTNLTLGQQLVSMNRNFIAVPVTVAIDAVKDTELEALTITVTQPGATQMITDQLKVQYLPELTTGTSIDGGTLAPLYSEVDTGNVTFTGTAAVKIRAVASITIGNITANGANGMNGNGGAGGPGGCDGGGEGTNGGCPAFDGGGGGGANNNGGGGGGFGEAGTPGVGGAAGGAQHGNAQVVNYVLAANNTNRSGGGGGGNAGFLTDTGGGGGGGGGSVELTAGGNIATGTITANGGNGAQGASLAGAGGGGGGSGGLVIVRSAAGMITGGAISAVGGAAGPPANAGGGAGGAGAVGRVRVDAPAGTLPASNPALHRGPTYAASTPLTTTSINPMLTLIGHDGDKLDGYVIDHDNMRRLGEPVDQTIANEMVTVEPTLIPGYNKLCFTLEPATRPSGTTPNELADTCIEIAYLP